MDLNKYIEIIVGSTAIIGIITFTVKKVIEKLLNTKFDILTRNSEKKLDIIKKVGGLLFEKEIKLYDSLLEISYKARNCARDFIQSNYKNHDKIIIHNTVCHDFENLLYQTKGHIDSILFDLIHTYKVNHKRLNLLFNENPESNNDEIAKKFSIIDNQYSDITEKLQSIIDSYKVELGLIEKKS